MEKDGVYEVRYGPNLKNSATLAACLVFVAAGFVADASPSLRAVTWLFSGGCTVITLLTMVNRRIALRVDAAGITLSGGPLRYDARLLSVPWTEVKAVVLWKQSAGGGSVRYLGLHLRPDSATLLADSGRGRRVLRATGPRLPNEIARFSRPIVGWRLNRDQLAASVERFAPNVELITLDRPGTLAAGRARRSGGEDRGSA